MPDIAQSRKVLADADAQRQQLAAQLAQTVSSLARERLRFVSLKAAGDTQGMESASATIRDLQAQRAASARAIGELREGVRVTLDGLLGTALKVEGGVPLVLLPVRVETRFTADGAALRVRIFHDALHTEALDEGLNDDERAAGIGYWDSVWKNGDVEAPWASLLAAVGRQRAAWVAAALRPTNIADRTSAAPAFPDTSPRSGRPATARTLPDRFYVRLEQDGAAPVTLAGAAIPDELTVGLVERDELSVLKLDDQDLPPIDASMRWLIDYDEALRVGMAVTVPLPKPKQTVLRLVVYGVRAALDPAAGAKRIENLIRAHCFTDGAEFLAQGTPTNNTDSDRTDWSRRTPPGPPALASVVLEPLANAVVAASALGIDTGLLASLANGGDPQQGRAAALNTALWATTWGDAIEHLTPAGRANGDQRLDNPALEAVRDHWVENVRGRGPLPVLRLGRQPYGLLPVVATDGSFKPLRSGLVENRLVPFIDQQIRWMWNDAQMNVPTVMNRALDLALPEILGTDAVLRALRVRTALSPDPVVGTATALLLPDLGNTASGEQVTKTLLILSGVADDALDNHDILGSKTRTLALPLVHDTDAAFVTNLLAPTPAAMIHKSVLQVLLAHADAVERHSRASVAAPESQGVLREVLAGNQVDLDRNLVQSAFEAAFAPAPGSSDLIAKAAEHLSAKVGRLDPRMVADRNPIAALAPVTMLSQVAGATPQLDRLGGNVGLQVIGEIFQRSTWSTRFRASLEVVAKIDSIDERRLLLAETLDCCSHRLDAWITATATRRLHDIRSAGQAGVLVGAYGWVENIELRASQPAGQIDGRDVLHDGADGGFVHAPGLAHAATAGILRSGRLSHLRGDPNDAALDIDLSSTRVRDALTLLDGMRRGQSLGALLGYRLERRLHERSRAGLELDRFIYVLRALAPLRPGKLTQPDAPVMESLAASNVVDGLRLMEIPAATVRQKLIDGPADTRYIVPPDQWVAPRAGEAEVVLAAIAELEQTHDAVADVLLAESVHQLAAGNPARAAAALDALAAGESVPPEPEVVRTPRTGIPIQHRVALLITDPPPRRVVDWNPLAPRAQAEPRLEAWARGALGDPATIAIASGHTAMLGRARLSALDVLYDADGDSVVSSTLVARLRAVIPDLGDDFSPLATTWELAGMLRTLLVRGRAMDEADVGRAADASATGRVPDTAELLGRATAAVTALKGAARLAEPLAGLAAFGVRPPPATAAHALSASEQSAAGDALFAEVAARIVAAEQFLTQAGAANTTKTTIELALKVLTTVFGAGFVAVPVLKPAPAGESDLWADAVGPSGVRPRAGADIRPWLARAGALRSACAAFGETLLVRDALGHRPTLCAVQSPAGTYASWVGLAFPDGKPPTLPLASMVAELAAGNEVGQLSGAVAGLVLDEWTEVIPRRLERRDPAQPEAAPELIDVATTGIAVNANAPGARPPQAILIALSADGQDWDGDRLVRVLDESLALARMRTITLQQLPYAGRQLPALYFRDWSLQGEPVINWAKVSTQFTADNSIRFLADK